METRKTQPSWRNVKCICFKLIEIYSIKGRSFPLPFCSPSELAVCRWWILPFPFRHTSFASSRCWLSLFLVLPWPVSTSTRTTPPQKSGTPRSETRSQKPLSVIQKVIESSRVLDTYSCIILYSKGWRLLGCRVHGTQRLVPFLYCLFPLHKKWWSHHHWFLLILYLRHHRSGAKGQWRLSSQNSRMDESLRIQHTDTHWWWSFQAVTRRQDYKWSWCIVCWGKTSWIL